MSSLKRKGAPSANPVTKDAKPASETRPSKKVKADKPGKSGDKKGSKITDKAPSTAPAIAVVKDDEPLFPRGGGSILTPLEHKQITIEAKRDALFEEQSGKPSKKAEKSDKSDKKKKRKSSTKEDKKSGRDEDAVKIEGLNYKVKPFPPSATTTWKYQVFANTICSALSRDRWYSARSARSTTSKSVSHCQTTLLVTYPSLPSHQSSRSASRQPQPRTIRQTTAKPTTTM